MSEKLFNLVGYYEGDRLVVARDLSAREAGRLARFYYYCLPRFWNVQHPFVQPQAPRDLPRPTVMFSPDGHEVRFGTPAGAKHEAAVYVTEAQAPAQAG